MGGGIGKAKNEVSDHWVRPEVVREPELDPAYFVQPLHLFIVRRNLQS
jgi:hypothetical protein